MKNCPSPRDAVAAVAAVADVAVAALAAVLLCASTPAQEKLVLPEDPLAAIAKMPVEKPAKEGKRVLVSDADGRPLAGVSVVAIAAVEGLDPSKMQSLQMQAMEKYAKSREKAQYALFALLGKRYVSDKEGVVLIPEMGRNGAVLAVRGKDTVLAPARLEKDGVIKLVLRKDVPIHVLVVGPKGKPARGVPVAITNSLEYGYTQQTPVKTDKAGRAQVRWGAYRHNPRGNLFVRAMAVTKKPVGFEVDPRTFKNDAQSPIKLTMPAFGQVRVYVVDKDKKPIPIEGATLTIQNPRARYGGMSQFQADSVEGDSATFSVVEVGVRFEVSCKYQGSQRPEKTKSDGPRHHMDMRVVTLKGVTPPARVRLRLLGLDGKPVLNEQVGIIFLQEQRMQGTMSKTDAAGNLDVVVPNEFDKTEEGRLVVVRRSWHPHGRVGYLGSKEIPFEQVKGKKNGIRDVRLVQEQLVASGLVVDKDGKPIPNARVTVQNIYGNFNSYGYSGRREFFDCQTRTGKDGRFELRALDADLGSVKLNVWANNYLVRSGGEVEAGTKDHKVVMVRAQTIHGKITGMKGMRYLQGVSMRVLDKDGVDQHKGMSADEKGNITIQNCLPGEYTVEFKLRRAKEPFLTIAGIKVEDGKPCKDPRMMSIDLSKHVCVVKIKVIGPDKKPLQANVSYHIIRERGSSSSGRGTDEKGECILILPKEGGHVSVSSRNGAFRSKRFPMLKNDVVAQLEPAVLVKLHIKGLPKLPDNLQFRLNVNPKVRERFDHKDSWGRHGRSYYQSRVDEAGKLELFVDKPGDYKLMLNPVLVSQGGRRSRYLNRNQIHLEFTAKKPEQGQEPKAIELKLDEDQVETFKSLIEEAKEAKKDGEDR